MPIEIIMPKVDMDMTTGTIATWHITEGGPVAKGAPLFDIETDKATMEVESPADGHLHFISASDGDVVEIGKCVAWIFAKGEKVAEPAQHLKTAATIKNTADIIAKPEIGAPEKQSKPDNSTNSDKMRATPLAKRIARSNNMDLSSISGSGPKGRINRQDVEQALANKSPAQLNSVTKSGPFASKEQLDELGIEYETIPVDRMRQTIAERLTESKSNVPHFYLEMDCQIDKLLAFRKELNEALVGIQDKKISINDILVRACAQALKYIPEANASWGDGEIIQYKDAHISVAVSIEGGLITPIVRKAHTKSINKISDEIADLAGRAKSGKLKPNEYQGGSFSISNLGMFGVKSFSAIINPPESMILAVGAARRQFIEDENGKPIGATILSVTLSCDHRVVDGALGAKWLSEFKRFIENPVLLGMNLE